MCVPLCRARGVRFRGRDADLPGQRPLPHRAPRRRGVVPRSRYECLRARALRSGRPAEHRRAVYCAESQVHTVLTSFGPCSTSWIAANGSWPIPRADSNWVCLGGCSSQDTDDWGRPWPSRSLLSRISARLGVRRCSILHAPSLSRLRSLGSRFDPPDLALGPLTHGLRGNTRRWTKRSILRIRAASAHFWVRCRLVMFRSCHGRFP